MDRREAILGHLGTLLGRRGLSGIALGPSWSPRGPLWWASHHRHHHIHSDTDNDPHSPDHGLLNSHMLWFFRRGNFPVIYSRVKDWARYPELRFLEHIDWIPFILLGVACYSLGEFLRHSSPQLGTNGMQLLIWGFFISRKQNLQRSRYGTSLK